LLLLVLFVVGGMTVLLVGSENVFSGVVGRDIQEIERETMSGAEKSARARPCMSGRYDDRAMT
jgi:hypothetical protein